MSRQRTTRACLVGLCALGLAAAPARAVVPTPNVTAGDLPRLAPPPSPPVDRPPVRAAPPLPPPQVRPRLRSRVGTPIPGDVDRAATGVAGLSEATTAAPAQEPVSAPPAGSAPETAGSQERDGAGDGRPTASNPSDSTNPTAAPAGSEQEAETQGSAKPPTDAPAGDPTPSAETSTEQPGAPSERPAPTVIERIVGVVPLPLKIAFGILAALLGVAVAGAWRTRRRLAQAERLAATDALTGLPNRRHAEEVIEHLLAAAQRTDRPLAVVLFDLDHFKQVNDRFGHAFGDEALRATADTARGLLRASDHVARFGGEEFLLMLPETRATDAVLVAEKLRTRIAGLDLTGLAGELTASFGVAAYPEHGMSAHDLITAADGALYRAKDSGRNRVESSRVQGLALAGGAERAA